MNLNELKAQIALGEDSPRQFKADVKNADSLAAEMAAFANSEGGPILIGVADDGSMPGLTRGRGPHQSAHQQCGQSACAQPADGADGEPGPGQRPYRHRADRAQGNRQTLFRQERGDLAQDRGRQAAGQLQGGAAPPVPDADQFHADELPTKAGIDKLDKLRFRDFLRDVYKQEYPDCPDELARLLQNMNLATDDGRLNLAGVLLFAERPEWIKPQFVVKAIRYPGNDIHVSDYLDTEDFLRAAAEALRRSPGLCHAQSAQGAGRARGECAGHAGDSGGGF